MAEQDELIGAMVRKLPAAGTPFPPEQRAAWLKMMAMAFDVAYGTTDELPAFLPATKEPAAMVDPAPAKPELPKRALPRFLIDEQGSARSDTGERLMPSDIIGPIYDLRGELGDLGAIVWADGSRGVVGLHLEISTSA